MISSGLIGFIGIGIVILVAISMGIFAFFQRRSAFSFREIRAFKSIQQAASLVVEDGTRMHVGLGNGSILTTFGASALAGLVLLERVGKIASLGDDPPLATSGDGLLTLVAQDTLRTVHGQVAANRLFDPTTSRMSGLTPLSYAAGVIPAIRTDNLSTNVFLGNFGPEVGLLAEAADRQNAPIIAASDSLPAQAVLYAASSDPLIGEELFAAGAYIQPGITHAASLIVQDIMRWLIIIALIIGALLKMAGLM